MAARLPRSAAQSFLAQTIAAATALALNILLARTLSIDEYGRYFLLVALADIASTFARLGFEGATLRFTAVAAGTGQTVAAARTLLRSFIVVGIAGSLIAATIGFVIEGQIVFVPHPLPTTIFAAAIIPLALLTVGTEALKAFGATGPAVFLQSTLFQVLVFTTIATLSYLSVVNLIAVAVVYLLAAIICLSLCFLLCARMLAKRRTADMGTQRATPLDVFLASAVGFYMANLLNITLAWIDTILLGYLSEPEQVAIFGVALRLAVVPTMIIIAISNSFSPKFAAANQDVPGQLRSLVRDSTALTAFFACPMCLCLVVAPELPLQLFGEQFIKASSVLRILALGQLINVGTGPLNSVLLMTGHQRVVVFNTAAAACCAVILTAGLAPSLGALGAAIASAIALVQLNLTACILVRVYLGINAVDYLLVWKAR